MRIQPWMTAVAGAVMLLAIHAPASGQTPDASDANFYAPNGGYGNAYGSAMAPVPGPNYVDPNVLYPQATPPEFQPWPQISPFHPGNVAQDQHYNSNGLWFRQILNQKRTFVGSIEAMAIVYADAGSATFGSAYAQNGSDGARNVPNGVPVDPYSGLYPSVPNFTPPVNGFYSVSPLIFPYPVISTTAVTVVSDKAYPIYGTSVLGTPKTVGGIKGNLGFFNEDDTGVIATAWWGGEGGRDFARGAEYINGIRVNQALTLQLGGQNLTPTNGNIPLYNGEPFEGVDFGDGSTAKYDVLYSVKNTTQAAGANFNIYQQPVYRTDAVKLRTLYGMRYTYIGEGFHFRGIDSGFNYNITGLTATSTGGGTSTTTYTGRPVSTSLQRLYDQYTATLNNTVESHIAGPEIGLRFDLGGPRSGFKMYGETNLGIAVNNEHIHLYGDNIGDPLFDVRFNGNTTPRMLDEGNRSEFNSKKNTTHVSPMFQQSIFGEFAILDVIPVIKNMSMFEYATFRVGYTFSWVGEVSRPTETINWQGFPLYPEIGNKRSSWWANQVSFALDWEY